jgi:hypothetical protein
VLSLRGNKCPSGPPNPLGIHPPTIIEQVAAATLTLPVFGPGIKLAPPAPRLGEGRAPAPAGSANSLI